MATRNPLDASITKLRGLFTAAERKILDSSTGKALATASEKQIRDLLRQGRNVRDKWRDLVGAQTRSVKRGSPRATGVKVVAATPTNERSRQKHGVFTDLVTHLEARLAEIVGQASTRKKPAAAKATAKARGASSARQSKATTTARSISRKARQAGVLKALESSAASGLRTTTSQQRSATAALKAERLKLKGVTTRRVGHTQARGGRAQARRDGRNAKR